MPTPDRLQLLIIARTTMHTPFEHLPVRQPHPSAAPLVLAGGLVEQVRAFSGGHDTRQPTANQIAS
jgi:hypothetical protein